MERCANSESLARYEREQEEAERRHDAFVAVVLDDLHLDYEDLKSRYDYIAERFDYDISFENFIRENI